LNAIFIRKNKDGFSMIKTLMMPLIIAGMTLGLAGCGYSPGSRAVSGGAIGAGAGSIIGAVTGLGPAGGALIGGAAGAIGGAVTNPRAINLGRPL
jgi:osmotically inducible lipoprotein OsmB